MADKAYAAFADLPKVLVDLGDGTYSERSVPHRPAAVACGQKKIAVTGTALALGAGVLFNGVVITAKASNTASLFIGGAGVTVTDDGSGNGYRLEPGQSISFAVADLGNLFVNGTAGDSVYYAGN